MQLCCQLDHGSLDPRGASLVAQMVKNAPAVWRPGFSPWVGKIPWRRPWQPTPVFLPGEPPWTEEPGGPQSVGVTQSQTGLKGLNTISIQFQFCTGTEFWRLVAKQSQYT